MTTPKEIVEFAKQNDVEMVDLKFIDFLGTWQHFTVPVSELNEEMLDEGRMFDGSSIRCWQTIDNSDMKVMPDLDTVKMDPFYEVATMSIICDIKDPVTGEGYTRDPRSVTKKAENYLISTGIGDTIFVGPEAEFFMFDDVRYAQGPEGGFYSIDSPECPWNTGVEEVGGNKAYKIGHKSGYFPAAPFDQDRDIRAEMVLAMQELG
jgi:glutamine synthetase